jgi:hypothetical protein
MRHQKISKADLAAYSGWSVMYSAKPSASGGHKKRYRHHNTGVIANSVPEINRIIQLYGHKHPSLCMRQVKVKMALPNPVDAMTAIVVADEGAHADVVQAAMPSAELGVPLLDVSTNSNSSMTGFDDSAHMGTFDLVLGEFNTWLADGASTHYTKVFKFLDQKGMEFRKKMYNYKQSKWYGVPLVALHSVANYEPGMPSFSFTQPPAPMPFVSKAIDSGITMNLVTEPSPEIIQMLALFAYDRKDLYTVYEDENGNFVESTDSSYFMSKFSESGMSFLYTTAVDGTILSVMSFVCYTSDTSIVLNILTTQANNKLAKKMGHTLSKGLGDQMFRCLMEVVSYNGGGYIYAECVLSGEGQKVWESHPMQESNVGNFIWLQLAMAMPADLGCEPKTMYVD